MKDYKEKKKPKKRIGYRTSKQFRRNFFREKSTMGARPRALGGHR